MTVAEEEMDAVHRLAEVLDQDSQCAGQQGDVQDLAEEVRHTMAAGQEHHRVADTIAGEAAGHIATAGRTVLLAADNHPAQADHTRLQAQAAGHRTQEALRTMAGHIAEVVQEAVRMPVADAVAEVHHSRNLAARTGQLEEEADCSSS